MTIFEDLCAGIGGGACRTITIENATVHAYGAEDEGYAATPAIGSGFPTVAFPTSIPIVTISNHSEVHAHRGGTIGNTDYIGWGGLNSYWKRNLYDKRVQRVLAHSAGRSKDARK